MSASQGDGFFPGVSVGLAIGGIIVAFLALALCVPRNTELPTDHAVKIGHARYNPQTGEKEWILFGTEVDEDARQPIDPAECARCRARGSNDRHSR